MSRGLGKIQRFVLDTLNASEEPLDTWDLTSRWANRKSVSHTQLRSSPTEADRSAVERAARSLLKKGMILREGVRRKGVGDIPFGVRWRRLITDDDRQKEAEKLRGFRPMMG